MSKIRVADFIAQHLENTGTRAAFMLSGGGMMHLMDALGRREKLKYYCNHHEHACALAAEGYARASGQLGACYATSGPGATNTLTGVVECFQDSVPVIFLSGQSKVSQTIQGTKSAGLRQFGTFEADIIPMVKPVTKYAVFLDDAKLVRYHVEKACYLATEGRPGPVFIDVPVDIQGAWVEPETLKGFSPEAEGYKPASALQPSTATLDAILKRLGEAQRPLLLAGHGIRCANQVTAFHDVMKLLGVPVATTQLATDLLPYRDPLYVGHPGMKGDRPGNFAVQTADVLLTIGSSLHVLTTGYELDKFAPKAHKIQVELDEAILRREQVGVQEKIHCGIEAFLNGLRERLEASGATATKPLFNGDAWRNRCAAWKEDFAVTREPHAHPNGQLNIYDLNDALSELCEEGDTIVADSGSSFYVIGQAFRVKKNQRVIVSGALGAMGHALPLAIGAALANPKGRVVILIGDGSFQTHVQELATIRHLGLNIKTFVVNNDGYVSIRNTQNNFFGGFLVGTSSSSGVSFPSTDLLAKAYTIPYFEAKTADRLKRAVGEALAGHGPALCEVFTAPTQDIIPTVSSAKRADGTMESKPLHDMAPFMDPENLRKALEG